jgi:hypothetical protein
MTGGDVMLAGIEPLPEDLIYTLPSGCGKRRCDETRFNENFAGLRQVHFLQRSKDAVFVNGTKSTHVPAILHRDILPVKAFRLRVTPEESMC